MYISTLYVNYPTVIGTASESAWNYYNVGNLVGGWLTGHFDLITKPGKKLTSFQGGPTANFYVSDAWHSDQRHNQTPTWYTRTSDPMLHV